MQQLSNGYFESANFKHAFSPQEDERLRSLVAIYGDKEWKLVAQKMPNRTTRQCRERYKSYLAPDIKNGPWTPEEDELLKQKFQEYGSKWSIIQSFFSSRSDVNIKNRWTIISGKMNKDHKIKAYILKTPDKPISSNSAENKSSTSPNIAEKSISILNNNSNSNNINPNIFRNKDNDYNLKLNSSSFQSNKTNFLNPIKSPISPSSPSILVQVSPPGISTQIHPPCITIHNSFSDQNQIQKCQTRNIPVTHISTNPLNAESTTQSFTSLQYPIQYEDTSSCLPQYKKQNLVSNEIPDSSITSSSIMGKNEKESENKIVHIKNKSSVVKKHIFPPISSLSIPSDDKLLLADRLFLPGDSRIDESFIASGPNLTLANNFIHYGGNIW